MMGIRVGVVVAGNQSMVGVGVRVWVGVGVAGRGAAGRRISHPEVKRRMLRAIVMMLLVRIGFLLIKLLISRS
jgi:hypothetical protein